MEWILIDTNTANYNNPNGGVIEVGISGRPSYYNTYDMSGNIFEWNDLDDIVRSVRGMRGGCWFFYEFSMSSDSRAELGLFINNNCSGFRIATILNNPMKLPNFVDITDINNVSDTNGFGGVNYEYKIAQYPVTNAEYVEFLNAIAKTDDNNLYKPSMQNAIIRHGTKNNFMYSIQKDMENKPVVYVNWFDCARYCNWLHNRKPNSNNQNGITTENGAYDLNSKSSLCSIRSYSKRNAVKKNAGASYWIPTENEWYKAAYYTPNKNNTGPGYWKYATQSDITPTRII